MEESLRQLVRRRAANRCEYCGLRQEDFPYGRFHIEHILPKKHEGGDEAENLALACNHCNLHKGPNLAGIDPQTGDLTPLFNPRTERWHDHFAFDQEFIVGLTPVGRTTVHVLRMNAPDRVALRERLRAS